MENAGKRPLDDDPRETDGDGRKKVKIDCDQLGLPDMEDVSIPKVKDPNKWKMLPEIVRELLGLFMAKGNAKDQSNEAKKEVLDDAKKESAVLSNQLNDEKCVVSENENSKNEHAYSKSNVENSSLSLEELLSSVVESNNLVEIIPTNEYPTLSLEESKRADEIKHTNTISSIEINPVESIDNNDQKDNQEINNAHEIPNVNQNSLSKNHSSIPSTSTSTLTLNDFKKTTQNIPPIRHQIMDLLKNLNLSGMAVVPTSKPPPCSCRHCVYADSLPIEQSAVKYRSPLSTGSQCNYRVYQSYNTSEMYSSNQISPECSDCTAKGNDCYCIKSNPNTSDTTTESYKQIWIAELSSLIRRNEDKFKIPEENNKNTSNSYVKTTVSKVKEVAKQIKTRITSCNFCKRSKYSVCNCSQRFKNENKYGDMNGKYYHHRRYYSSYRY